jgi:hypothetical protein
VGIVLASAGIAFAVVRWRRRARTGREAGGPTLAGADGSRLDDDMDRYEL